MICMLQLCFELKGLFRVTQPIPFLFHTVAVDRHERTEFGAVETESKNWVMKFCCPIR